MDRQSLEDAMARLESLVANDTATEDDFQQWFEANPVVFEVLGYHKVLSKPKLTEAGVEKYVPDFMVQRVDGLWEVLEIKRPYTRVLRDTQRRATFYAAMETYLSQCREYSQYFSDRANRDEFRTRYQESVQVQPSSTLIAGRSDGLDRQKVHGLLGGRVPSVLHQTYDDLQNRLEFQRARLYSVYEDLQGFSIHLILVIVRPTTPTETFILDLGADMDRDRLSVHVHPTGALLLSIHDSNGLLHQVAVAQGEQTFRYDRTFYLSLEVGCTAAYSVVAIETNGRYCSEQKLSGFPFRIDVPAPLVMGSDQSGQIESSMRIAEKCMYNRTLLFQEKAQLRNYFFDKYKEYLFSVDRRPRGVQFLGRQFLYTEGHPRFADPANPRPRSMNMVQDDDAWRPQFREAG